MGLLLGQAAAVVTVVLGLMGLVFPARAATFTGLSAQSRTGFGEFRATYGGLFVALGLAPLVLGQPVVFCVVSVTWLGTAVGRLVSLVVDGGLRASRWCPRPGGERAAPPNLAFLSAALAAKGSSERRGDTSSSRDCTR